MGGSVGASHIYTVNQRNSEQYKDPDFVYRLRHVVLGITRELEEWAIRITSHRWGNAGAAGLE